MGDSTALALVVVAGLALLVGLVRWWSATSGGIWAAPLDTAWREMLTPALIAATLVLLAVARLVHSEFWQQFVLDCAAGVGAFVLASRFRVQRQARLALLLGPLAAGCSWRHSCRRSMGTPPRSSVRLAELAACEQRLDGGCGGEQPGVEDVDQLVAPGATRSKLVSRAPRPRAMRRRRE
jgi:hypothetical protein